MNGASFNFLNTGLRVSAEDFLIPNSAKSIEKSQTFRKSSAKNLCPVDTLMARSLRAAPRRH